MHAAFIHQRIPKESVTGAHAYDALLARELDSVGVCEIMEAGSRKFSAPLSNLRLWRRLRGKSGKYDLVIFNSSKFLYFLPLALILRLSSVRTAATHHLPIYKEFRGLKRLIYRLGEAAFLRSVKIVISPSPYISEELKGCYGITPLYIPIPFSPVQEISAPGISAPEILSPAESDSSPAERMVNKPGRLLYTATIEPRKGLLDAVKAMTVMKRHGVECRLDVAGTVRNKKYFEEVKRVIASEGLEVSFLGQLSQRELGALRRKADVFLFPTYGEGYGMALCEAMQYGLPTVSYDNTSIPYLIRNNENGIYVPTGDIDALAEANERLLTDQALRRRIAAGAFRSALALPGIADFRRALQQLIVRGSGGSC